MSNYIWSKAEEFVRQIDAWRTNLENQIFGDSLSNIFSQPGIKGTLQKIDLISTLFSAGTTNYSNGLLAFISGKAFENQDPPEIPVQQMTLWQYSNHVGQNEDAYPAGILTVPLEKAVAAIAPLYNLDIYDPSFFQTQEWYTLREYAVRFLWDPKSATVPIIWTHRQEAWINSLWGIRFNAWASNITLKMGVYECDNFSELSDLASLTNPPIYTFPSGANHFKTLGQNVLQYPWYFYHWTDDPDVRWQVISSVRQDNTYVWECSCLCDHSFEYYSYSTSDPNFDYDKTVSGVTIKESEYFAHNGKVVHYLRYGNAVRDTKYSQYTGGDTLTLLEPAVTPDAYHLNGLEYSNMFGDNYANYLKWSSWLLMFSSTEAGVDGIRRWTGNSVDPTQTTIIVPQDDNATPSTYYKIFIPPYQTNLTQDPNLYPNPQDNTPSTNVEPYIPSTNTPLPTVVPDPSPQVGPSPSNPSDAVDPDIIDWYKDYDDQIVTPEITPPTSPTETYPLPSGYNGTSGASGMIHVYRPSPTAFNDFAAWLWVKWSDPVSVPRFWNNPIDGIISAHELYWGGHASGSEFIRSGFLESTVSAPVVDARYDTLDCGSVDVPEYYGNYMDYSPYVKVSVYLPFVGIVELNPDDIIGSQVHIMYNTDAYTGACLAQILCTRGGVTQKLYEYNGNCAVTIPLSGGTQAQIVTGLLNAGSQVINGVGQLVTTALTGGAPNIGGLASDVLGAASTVLSAKSSVQHSGTFSSNYGAMGSKKPYLIIRRPILVNATNFNLEYGYPAHKRVTIGACTGYLRVREVNVVSATATDEEKQEIESLLKAGVYVS